MLRNRMNILILAIIAVTALAGCSGNTINTPGYYSGPGGSSFATAIAPNYGTGAFDKYSYSVNYCDIYCSISAPTDEQWFLIPSVSGGYGITVTITKQSGELPITIYGELYDQSGSHISGGGEIVSPSSGLSETYYLSPSAQNYALRVRGNGSQSFGFKATVIYGSGVSY
ncbi:MAG: hypothetical protein WC490_03390 [Candidatus Margulisiibacteriota bacterium]